MEAALVIEALGRALGHRKLTPDQLMNHTNQSRVYQAIADSELFRKYG
jgi:hypothetical protein